MAAISAAPANAANVGMRNDPAYYSYGSCSGGNVVMSYYYTDRRDITLATYYDQYVSGGVWKNSYSRTLDDADTRDYTMIDNFLGSDVRVRANHYVTTTQGPYCSQR